MSLISVVIPGYNCEKTIRRSIQSVLSQTYRDLEVIFVNDCSTDGTLDILKSFDDERLRIFSLDKNSGGAVKPRNFAIQKAKGDFIAFLDADDYWLECKIEKQLRAMVEANTDAACSFYKRVNAVSGNGTLVSCPEFISYEMLLKTNHIGNLTGIYNCKKLGKIFQKEIGHEDYLMWLQILSKTKCVSVQEVLAVYNVLENSLSANKIQAMKWHFSILKNELGFSLFKSTYYFCFYIINAILKRV